VRAVPGLRGGPVPRWALVAAIVVTAVFGFWAGTESPVGTTRLNVKSGTALLQNKDNWLTSFDTRNPDDQMSFYANTIWSESAVGSSESGVPPCLRVGHRVHVRIGYTTVHFPSGQKAPEVLWLECPGA
jgi:hypothetical protein